MKWLREIQTRERETRGKRQKTKRPRTYFPDCFSCLRGIEPYKLECFIEIELEVEVRHRLVEGEGGGRQGRHGVEGHVTAADGAFRGEEVLTWTRRERHRVSTRPRRSGTRGFLTLSLNTGRGNCHKIKSGA